MILLKVSQSNVENNTRNQSADKMELEIVTPNKESATEKMKKIKLSDHYASDEETIPIRNIKPENILPIKSKFIHRHN